MPQCSDPNDPLTEFDEPVNVPSGDGGIEGGITIRQEEYIQRLLDEIGAEEGYALEQMDRSVTQMSELTREEASDLIDFLKQEKYHHDAMSDPSS